MAMRPKKKAASKRAQPKRKATPRMKRKASRKEQAPRPIYELYRRTMDDLWAKMAGGLVVHLKAAVREHTEIVATAYWGWRVSRHPQVAPRVRDDLTKAKFRYDTPTARAYAAYVMDHASSEIDVGFVKRYRDVLQATFERLDLLLQRGDWQLAPVPTVADILAKMRELGGGDPATTTGNIYRNWVHAKKRTKAQAKAAEEEEIARQTGQTPDEVREDAAKRNASRKRDLYLRRLQQFTTDVSETGELVQACVGDGMYVIRGGRKVKLTTETLEIIVNLWNTWKNRQKRERSGAANP